ncbi:DUF3592 domain-containing protein [Bordetella genomosp. 13]|uniref:DUF3592 domain-containing protein n=1 Tax=Bordetella genomosp. 13 TaxID=463040 RepID=UPI00119DCC7D|nr:DUF3592 domain-containing protein [Bordetella genomosp. 13]
MQWVKYLMITLTAALLIWAAWAAYSADYGTAGGMLFSALVVGGIYLFMLHPYVRQDALLARLDKEGVRAQGSIVSVQETSSYVNEVPVMRVNVRYSVNGKEHSHEVKQPIPYQALASVRPGKRISILVDPKNTDQFLLQF